ncbi:hypothetical protein K503DRAFT_858735 [Rhizopogon vinicolor AM-OR11-026]|uniref:Uncharacterized protein n=1 Tax=Rhizopogon vinicolor AM-OR11-026 TaxID=1314800 RepID=A0A1B7MRQ4_9AGAM|nr:hypothetical protein K503DRAFT_858735 [Rhizopogon vinicolor AM-OR11-026]
MALCGPKARRHARAKRSSSGDAAEKQEWESKVSGPCTSVSISQKHISAAGVHFVKRQGSLTDPLILLRKFHMHMFMRIAPKIQTLRECDPEAPANQKRVGRERSKTWPIPVQCPANARLYLRTTEAMMGARDVAGQRKCTTSAVNVARLYPSSGYSPPGDVRALGSNPALEYPPSDKELLPRKSLAAFAKETALC